MADDEKSKNQILQAFDALSHTFYQKRATRRTISLALPRKADDNGNDAAGGVDAVLPEPRPLSRCLSMMSPFRSRSKHNKHGKDDDDEDDDDDGSQSFAAATPDAPDAAAEKKKGIWGWKPIRTLSHIGKQRVGCVFSIEVVAAQGLPPSMNGLRLAVAVRRKETRNGTLHTMPARVQKGAADFNETLYVQCHLYSNGGCGSATSKPLRFEPWPFLISAIAMDTPELDFGQNTVDLSSLVKEFKEKCQQGLCPRRWDMTFPLAGKAKGGYLVVSLAFHIMDDGGLGLINSQPDVAGKTTNSSSSSSLARKLSKSSFRIKSPNIVRPPRGSLPGGTLETLATTAPIPRSQLAAARARHGKPA